MFTTTTEAGLYLTEALQVLNANTSIWNAQYVIDWVPGSGWQSLNQAGSPRVRTITDTDIYTQMQYMLMEPPTGSVWTGTNQFNITNFSQALQYRRDELLLASGANVVNITDINSPIAGVTTTLPDTVLNLRRVRWIPAAPSAQDPFTLWREDIRSANAYGDSLSLQSGIPESWMITANAPLTFDVGVNPNTEGTWDLLAMESGVALTPPTSNILGLPNDWCWVAKYGALADCLANSPEASDPLRAKYCLDRYQRGMKAMLNLPWLLQASVANLPVDTVSYVEMDAYSQSWETNANSDDPQIVVGGMDFVALAPFVPSAQAATVSSVLTVVGNAPIPISADDPIQLSRDGVEAVLCYAQHIASFKMGGADFQATMPLYKQFEDYCAVQNKRYAALGIFRPEMLLQGSRGMDIDPEFGPPKGVKNV